MCPACMSTLVLVAAGTGSTGGLTAWIATRLRRIRSKDRNRKVAAEAPKQQEQLR
jgi:hypothetical protein